MVVTTDGGVVGAGLTGGIVGPLPTAAQIDTTRVRSWLLREVNGCKSRAETASADLWKSIDAENKAYGLRDHTLSPQEAGIKAASLEQEYEVKTKDLSDQVDEMVALIMDLFTGNEIRRMVGRPGVSAKQVEITTKVQDALLKEKQFMRELRRAVGRFVRNRYAGFKVCRTKEVTYATDREFLPAALYSDDELLDRGFTAEQILDGTALPMAVADDGLMFIGIADQREDGSYENLLCAKYRAAEQEHVYIKAANPRRIAIVDPTRPITQQPSIHEFHYPTASELRRAGFSHERVAELEGKSSGITDTGQQNPGGQRSSASSGQQGRLDKPVYEVCETWQEIDWRGGVESGKFTDEELRAFCIEEGFPAELCVYECFKWCVWHSKDECLLAVHPNYMKDKTEYPYDAESFVDSDGEMAGNSLMERLSNVAANMLAFLNLTARSIKKNLYQSMFISRRLGLTEETIKRLNKEGGVVPVDDSLEGIADLIHTWQQPDVSRQGMSMVQYFDEKKRGLGVPSILAGEGQADTATQDSINNRRGQTTVNEAFGRFVLMLMEVYRKHLGAMVENFTVSRYVEIAGEDGMTLTREWVMPTELTDKLDIIPMVKFNDGEKQRMVQFLLGIMNVLAPVQGPPVVLEVAKVCMEMAGLDQSTIDRIEKRVGSATNVQQEIEAMLIDPDMTPEVRMDDNHPVCIQMAKLAIADMAQKAMMQGLPFQPPQNIMEYIQMHEAMLMQQQAMAQMQQVMAGGAPEQGPKGKPVQARPDGGPGNEEGSARQAGQSVGAGNKGPMSAAGLTGQGSVGLVKGAPAGI